MSSALVFYTISRTKEVLPISAIPQGSNCGDIVKCRWNRRQYKAKEYLWVLYIGQKEFCDIKSNKVTEEGDLLESEFDVTNLSLSDFEEDEENGDSQQISLLKELKQLLTKEIKELMTRATKMEDMLSILVADEKKRSEEHARLMQIVLQREKTQREMLRRIPTIQVQGEITYIWASAKCVAEIRQLKGLNMSHFVLALETEVYKDDTTELELIVDSRSSTKDRVLFLQQCLNIYYEIPAHLRESAWKKAKEALNSRVRRLRKTMKDRRTQSSSSSASRARNDDDDVYFFDDEN